LKHYKYNYKFQFVGLNKMNFTSDALFYNGKRYQIPSNVVEDIREVLDSVKIDEANNASIEKGK